MPNCRISGGFQFHLSLKRPFFDEDGVGKAPSSPPYPTKFSPTNQLKEFEEVESRSLSFPPTQPSLSNSVRLQWFCIKKTGRVSNDRTIRQPVDKRRTDPLWTMQSKRKKNFWLNLTFLLSGQKKESRLLGLRFLYFWINFLLFICSSAIKLNAVLTWVMTDGRLLINVPKHYSS